MDNATDAISVQLFPRGEAKKSAIFIRKANFIAPNVPSPHDKSSRIRRETHPLLAFPQSLLLVYQFSDVHARTDVASEVFLSVIARHTAIRNPAIFAVVASQAILHDERLPRLECLRVNLETPLQIVRVHAFDPAISHFLLQAASGKVEPRFVKESAEFVQARHPDKDGRRVSYDSETFFAFPKRALRLFAECDVAGNPAHENRLAVTVELDPAETSDPAGPPVWSDYPVFAFVLTAFGERAPYRLFDALAVLDVQRFKESTEVQRVGLREAKQLPPFARHPHFIARDVPSPRDQICRLRGEAHASFALAQLRFAHLQLARERRRAEKITTQFEGHCHDDALVDQAHR